jgi:hypothetical protein
MKTPIHSSKYHNNLRITHTMSNPEPKVDSKGRVTNMDGRVRKPIPRIACARDKQDYIFPPRLVRIFRHLGVS